MAKLSGPARVPGRARGSGQARAPRRLPVLAAGGTAVAVTAALALAGGGAAAARTVTAATARPQVRVNQVGYAPFGPKQAFAMVARPVRAVKFTVTGPRGLTFYGRSTADVGRWNSRYGAVYQLDFSRLTRPGRYRVKIDASGATAVSPAFRIAPSADLYHQLVSNAVRFFTSERDGGDVMHSVLNREPANLTDRRATVYANPRYDSNDNLLGKFRKIAGPVDVSGGWFDAGGGYEKFAYTASYTDGLMLLAARSDPGQDPALSREAGFGLSWLEKLWNPARKVMYIQVGIGNGNASNTIQGDYNFWFLPQREDQMNVKKGGNPGPTAYYVKYRPVFEAAAPGHQIDPDFAGRFAADFAMAAQLAARGHSRASQARAGHLLQLARGVYAMARTSHLGQLITAYPHDYYPGSQWKSDMLWGAAEITLAEKALHAPGREIRAAYDTAQHWAEAYLAQGHPAGGDTLNLYDTGAIAEAEFLQASAGMWSGIRPGAIQADLARQLQVGEGWARHDPFELGTDLGPSDAAPHAFGLYITNALYQRYGGSGRYQAFAQQQLNYALGANPWGTTFVVGAGSTYPHCMQSEIANLAGSLTGRGDIQLGAATDGPSSAGNFVGLGTVSGMRKCGAGNFKPFDTKAVGYEDNVVSWPSVEPADDYSADSLLAFALAAGPSRHPWSR